MPFTNAARLILRLNVRQASCLKTKRVLLPAYYGTLLHAGISWEHRYMANSGALSIPASRGLGPSD